MSTIIIAAGGTPPDKKEFLDYAAVCDMIIAADSGADWLSCYGVTPNLLIGDFDSAKKTVISAYQIKGVKTITAKVEKDETDLMLAAQYAVKSNADKVIIFGGTGRRIDHLLGNFQVMYYLLKNNIRPIMIDLSLIHIYIRNCKTFSRKRYCRGMRTAAGSFFKGRG